jgi:hypothetical protein
MGYTMALTTFRELLQYGLGMGFWMTAGAWDCHGVLIFVTKRARKIMVFGRTFCQEISCFFVA